jgi:hypothetical protein
MRVPTAVSCHTYDGASSDVIILPPVERRVHTFGRETIIASLSPSSASTHLSSSTSPRISSSAALSSTMAVPTTASPPGWSTASSATSRTTSSRSPPRMTQSFATLLRITRSLPLLRTPSLLRSCVGPRCPVLGHCHSAC